MTDAANPILVGNKDIARIAGVSQSAVSNWRSRHDDFPAPHATTGAGPLYALDEVERWLLDNDKIESRVSPATVLWRIADAFRGIWSTTELWEFMTGLLVYLVACDRAQRGEGIEIALRDRWHHLRQERPEDLMSRLQLAADRIEQANPQLRDLLIPTFDKSSPPPRAVAQLIAALRSALDEEDVEEAELFHEISELLERSGRGGPVHTTPDDLAMLIVRLVAPVGPRVLDPAAGHGGLLLLAALAGAPADAPLELKGYELNVDAVRYARAWFFIYGVDVELELQNALILAPDQLGPVDTLVVDPPYSVTDWGQNDLYQDDRWVFGQPPRQSSDFAWLQLAALSLSDEGRAAVVLPTGTTFRGGQEGEIRARLVEDGRVEAVIHLPPRLRADTNIPLAVWLLRGTPRTVDLPAILLVDATDLGQAGRRTTELTEAEVERVAAIVEAHRMGKPLADDEPWRSVTVSPGQLRDAALVPGRYRDPAADIDTNALRAQADEIRQRLAQERIWVARHVLDGLEQHVSRERR